MSAFPLFLAAAALFPAFALFESSVLVQQMTKEEMRAAVQDPDYLTFVMLYDDQGQNSQLVAPIIEKVADNYRDFLKFVAIDCTYDEKTCPKDVRERLPALTAYVPLGLNPYSGKPWVTTKVYKGAISPRELSDFLVENMPFLGETLENETLRWFLSEDTLAKVMLFTDKSAVSPLFKAAASKYRGRLDFGVVWKNQTQILEKYSVSAFPTILAIDKSGVHSYSGEAKFADFCEFLHSYAAKDRIPITLRKPDTEKTGKSTDFRTVETSEDGLEAVLEDSKQVAVVQFYSDFMATEWMHLSKSLSGIVLLVEVKCKASFAGAKKLGVSKLPAIRVFPANRKRKSFALNDEFESDLLKELKGSIETVNDVSINRFVEQMKVEKSVGCVFFTEKPVSLAMKGLASDAFFSEAIHFAYFNKRNQEILARLNTKRYPTLTCFVVLNEKGEMRVVEFEGDLGKYGELYYFMEEVALPGLSKVPLPRKEMDLEEIQEWDTDSFEAECVHKGGFCVLAFFDGSIVLAM